jgi:LuxR family maltose regulon positive regulatory protein
VFLARLKLAQGDVAGATAMLAQADQSAHQQNFVYRTPEVAAVQVLTHEFPINQARVHLALQDASAVLAG